MSTAESRDGQRYLSTAAAPTLVILDEIHHGGDNLSWGDAIREAFEPATRRLALTGTPFRSDTSPIPLVRYEMGADSIRRSEADYTYGYAEALRDGIVRPVLFLAYGGSMRWRTKAGDEMSARLGEPMTKDASAHAWRTALAARVSGSRRSWRQRTSGWPQSTPGRSPSSEPSSPRCG